MRCSEVIELNVDHAAMLEVYRPEERVSKNAEI